ncbi:Nucleotide-binding universal stress protein, UspA family [Lentzea waywayandensis]|uniref:Nucleotide-binding universal stress protein, UspA family n=1 Tax=Lentzea waywayandensis TaxID=84724 RepID=A0A1I6DCJ1_9PSEU|nr:universal stress protein [Lentzea waywayandensis]SFR03159.1 Nucleotide-binding universal stress protein, UspA family [Lentzea waywayandensis]
MTVTRPVVVGLDGSKSATHAVRWAAEEAARRKTGLVITHSCVLVPARTLDVIAPAESYSDGVLEEGRQWLAEAADAAGKAAPGIDVKIELAAGDAAEQLVGRSASAGLLVLGSHGRGGFAGLLAGSTAVAVTTHAHCPVVVVRNTGADPSPDAPVVVGLDGSPASDAALDFALDAAALRSVALHAVRTWWDITAETAWQRGLTATNLASIEAAEHRLLAEQVAGPSAARPDVPVRQFLTRDRPAHTLVEQSAHARLIVVGTRGRGGFRGLLLGSTSQALIRHAHCPVSVVPLA